MTFLDPVKVNSLRPQTVASFCVFQPLLLVCYTKDYFEEENVYLTESMPPKNFPLYLLLSSNPKRKTRRYLLRSRLLWTEYFSSSSS